MSRQLIVDGKPNDNVNIDFCTEADIQFEIAKMLERHGINPKLEVRIEDHFDVNKKTAVLDIVGFMGKKPVVAFEVKTPKSANRTNSHTIKQHAINTWLTNNGIPSFMVSCASQAEELIVRKSIHKPQH